MRIPNFLEMASHKKLRILPKFLIFWSTNFRTDSLEIGYLVGLMPVSVQL